jgi:hypothetical protein
VFFFCATTQNYTQYIPLSIYDLQQWMGTPSIYVFDCSAAGQIVDAFVQFEAQFKDKVRCIRQPDGGHCVHA